MRPVPACPSSSRLAGACKGPALHLYIQICACTHTHTHACILIPGYKCIYLLMHTCMHTHTHTHIYIYLYIRTYIYEYMNNTHTHMHICVHTYMHAYACVCVCVHLQLDCSWTAAGLQGASTAPLLRAGAVPGMCCCQPWGGTSVRPAQPAQAVSASWAP